MSELVLNAPVGANRSRKRLGRGSGSGLGKTSGKGHKGQNARSGGGVKPGFEGGQMPLYRRLAARGFSNYPFKKINRIINIADIETAYNNGEKVNMETLLEKALIRKSDKNVKLLGNGELTKKLDVYLKSISASAKEKIEKAGGSIVPINEANGDR
ncbi:MAG: 50S ribosomal protein L15 [Spirochaetes bacterium]|nr:50S ribosomal protein L15 [Spirochaetota bacterium]